MNRSSFSPVIAFAPAGLFPLGLGIARMASSSQQSEGRGQTAAPGAEISAEQVIERYASALGGGGALEKIKSRWIKGTAEYTGSSERATASLEYYWKAPEKTLAIQKASFGYIKRGFNGSQGWAVLQWLSTSWAQMADQLWNPSLITNVVNETNRRAIRAVARPQVQNLCVDS